MFHTKRTLAASLLAGLLVLSVTLPAGAAPKRLVKKNARVAVVGDSITEQKLYSLYIEMYLTACQPELNAAVCQFGWSGEQAPRFVRRMENDLALFAPTLVTTCYGMNDGWYRPYTPNCGQQYEKAMREIVSNIKAKGATVIVGGPGAVDTHYFRRGKPFNGPAYNKTLAELNKIAAKVAADNKMPYADVFDTMKQVMAKAKASRGKEYAVAGHDGVHPGKNGHLVMAYAFLKRMGFTGDLGTITVDMKGKATSADKAHQVVASKAGQAQIKSSRYPFCFTGNGKSDNETRSILPFLPFNQDLNRLTLKVTNGKAARMKVTWGKVSKEFSRQELEKGINLAAEFIPNPFNAPFAKMKDVAARKERYETVLVKEMLRSFGRMQNEVKENAEMARSVATIKKILWKKQQDHAKMVKAALVPVTHTITVEPVKNK